MATDVKLLAEEFYKAFSIRDGATMADFYWPDATFSDEVFPSLTGQEAGQMWRMLCTQGKDLSVDYTVRSCGGQTVIVDWIARYTFSKTGRKVTNNVSATLEFRDGKIIRHRDVFSFWKWSIQALGPIGLVLGWTPLLRKQVQQQASTSLDHFDRVARLTGA
jgi:ketosteroid isomerase-like protein